MTQEAKKSNDAVTMTTVTTSNIFSKILNLVPSKRSRTVLLVILVVIGGIVYTNTNIPSKVPPFNQASVLILSGGKYEDAIKILDRVIRNTSNKKTIADINLQKATISISTDHLDKAMQYAKVAESTYPTSSSSSMIAEVAKIQYNKPLAIQWYKTTISRLDKNSQGYVQTLQELQNYIKELGQ